MGKWRIWFHPGKTFRELEALAAEKKSLEEEIVRLRLDMEQEQRYSETLAMQLDARDKELAAARIELERGEELVEKTGRAVKNYLKEMENLRRENEDFQAQIKVLREDMEKEKGKPTVSMADTGNPSEGIVSRKDFRRDPAIEEKSDMLEDGESPFLADDSDWLKPLPK